MTVKKWVFMGSPEFAVTISNTLNPACLEGLIGIFTRPDAPKGRGQHRHPSPVAEWAIQHQIPVMYPQNSHDLIPMHAPLNPDFAIVAAYGLMIPKSLTDSMPIINVHPSLLPKFRGATPIQAAIRAGLTETGVTLIQLTEQLDAGPIYASQSLPIDTHDVAGNLAHRLAIAGGHLVSEWILNRGWNRTPIPQNDTLATYCGKIDPNDLIINPYGNPVDILCQIRAYSPKPGAYVMVNNRRIRILTAHIQHNQIMIDTVAPPGKNPMPYRDFCNGNGSIPGWPN